VTDLLLSQPSRQRAAFPSKSSLSVKEKSSFPVKEQPYRQRAAFSSKSRRFAWIWRKEEKGELARKPSPLGVVLKAFKGL
jgi:hypothetical protein